MKKGKTVRAVFKICVLLAAVSALESCATVYKEKLYADVIGFNDDVSNASVERYPFYDLTDPKQVNQMNQAIMALRDGENTAAYYALDVGLDRIEYVQRWLMEKDPNTKYYVVFFTDGLDNVSLELAKRYWRAGLFQKADYANTIEYGEALQNRMKNILRTYRFFGLVQGPNLTNSFQSYVLLYRGNDIEQSGYTREELDVRLKPFTGAQNEQRPVVIQGTDLNKLLADFKNAFVVSSFSFIIPKGYTGFRIRMQLNGAEREAEKIYFEADLKKETRQKFFIFTEDMYTLENIKTSGALTLEIPGSGKIEMDKLSYVKGSNTVPFVVNSLKLGETPLAVDRSVVQQWFYDDGRLRWNSEYNSASASKKNAYILLIMDTSRSFREALLPAKETASAMVRYISEQM